jgi:hypothetical protein
MASSDDGAGLNGNAVNAVSDRGQQSGPEPGGLRPVSTRSRLDGRGGDDSD